MQGVFGFPDGRGRSAWCRLGATYTAPYPMSEIGNQHYFIGGNPRDFDLAEVEVYVVRRDLGRRRKKILQRQEKMAVRSPPNAPLHDSPSLISTSVVGRVVSCRLVLRVRVGWCRNVRRR